jgi:hypothetical protein
MQGECLLKMNDRTVAEGFCHVLFYSGASYQIVGRSGEPTVMVNIDVSGDRAQAFWNGEERGAHAREPLGAVTQQQECWVNDQLRVCGWPPGPRPR